MSTYQADALAPTGPLASLRYLRTLRTSPGWRWWTAFVLVFGLGVGASVVGTSLLGRAVDLIQGRSVAPFGSGTTALAWVIGLSCLGLVAEAFVRAAGNYLLISRSRLVTVELRKACLAATLRAPIPKILELGSGNVITRMTKDVDTITSTVTALGTRAIITAVMFPFTLIALMFIHWSYLVIVLLVVGLLIFPVRMMMRYLPVVANSYSSAEARRNNLLLDTIRGMDTTRAFGMQSWARGRVERSSWDAVQRLLDVVPVKNFTIWWGSAIYALLLGGNFAFSAWLIQHGVISVGAGSAAVILVSRLEIHIFNSLGFAGELQVAVTAMGRAVALAMINDDVRSDQGPALPDLHESPDIEVSHLVFGYPNTPPILRDINLRFEAGSTTAIVGASGAGKSTLANLLAGLLTPTSGTIRIGGHQVKPSDHMWVARHVTLISQEVHVFSGTLRQDLLMASPSASDDELLDALAFVGLEQDSQLWKRWFSKGLDTPVGAGAEAIAPEVGQYLALARVVLRNSPALILDEATSEAGSELAAGLENAALSVTRDRTAIVVAHRLQQAMLADRILVMADGQVVEDGTHEELVARGGTYAELFQEWSK